MAKKTTKLQGFYQGAPQVVDFVKGDIITQEYYRKELARLNKISEKYPDFEVGEEVNEEMIKNAEEKDKLKARKKVSDNYVVFKNYTKQIQDLYSGKKKEITHNDLKQLAANNIVVSELNLGGGEVSKYGDKGSFALQKFIGIIMNNDYKKLQYISQFPQSSLKNINFKDISNLSLPQTDSASYESYNALKKQMSALSERLKELDNNMHINSLEFRRMKSAANALVKTLEKPWERCDQLLVGEQLEALQAASMDYVKAKGVGRQSSQLGKDRMDFALDICGMSSEFMDIFASEARIREVRDFEKDVMGIKMTNRGVCKLFTSIELGIHTKANIFENEEKHIDQLGKKSDEEFDEYDHEIEDRNAKAAAKASAKEKQEKEVADKVARALNNLKESDELEDDEDELEDKYAKAKSVKVVDDDELEDDEDELEDNEDELEDDEDELEESYVKPEPIKETVVEVKDNKPKMEEPIDAERNAMFDYDDDDFEFGM